MYLCEKNTVSAGAWSGHWKEWTWAYLLAKLWGARAERIKGGAQNEGQPVILQGGTSLDKLFVAYPPK